MLEWFTANVTGLSIIGSAIAFVWPIVQFVITRRRDLQLREFEIYHRLIKELVSPDSDGASLWVDRQAAILFELRNFKRYYEFSARTLIGLRTKWAAQPMQFPRLMQELDLTIAFLEKKVPNHRFYLTDGWLGSSVAKPPEE
ncbi:MAG: hypothetical protein AAF086_07465 [Planctomycetota bacterium]